MKICINVGHTLSGTGTGAVGIKNESNENRKVASEVIRLLEGDGHSVVTSRVDYANSNTEYLKKCVDVANNSNCELFVSIHFNSFDGNAYGVECFHYEGNNKGKYIASRICQRISELGFKNRGAKDGSHLYVIKNTLMDAVLVECCFIDNKDDMKKYDYVKMAKAIYSGIVDKVDNPESDGEDIYRVCIGSFKDKENANKCLKEVKSKGYSDAFIVTKTK